MWLWTYLECLAVEVLAAELALDLPLGAGVLQVVFQADPRQQRTAAVRARDRVVTANSQVALEIAVRWKS